MDETKNNQPTETPIEPTETVTEPTQPTESTQSTEPATGTQSTKPDLVDISNIYQPKDKKPLNLNQAAPTVAAVLALLCSVISLTLVTTGRVGTSSVFYTNGPDGNSANFTEGSISDIASRVSPSVVSIVTETRTMSWWGQESTSSSAGTGFIITGDGYILTNKHVVDGANEIVIVADDGTTYTNVSLIGTDPLADVAVLKINDVSDLPAVTLGNSKTTAVGQQVIAIGNALGQYQNTVTEGIISGKNRTITATDGTGSNTETLADMIQTDASINPGNSGGPLVNAAGQVIGINTATSTSGEGLGFAIPISSVKGLIKSVTETGKIQRAYLGVYYVNLTPETAKTYRLSVSAGAYIRSSSDTSGKKPASAVIKDSPAEKAGLQEGDIIIAVNGAKIGEAGSLSSLLGEYSVGDEVTLTYLRDGAEKTTRVTLAEYNTKNS